MISTGKLLVLFGFILIGVGILMQMAGRIPWLGRLPGDIIIQKKNFTVYFPFATSIIISIVISLILWFWSRR